MRKVIAPVMLLLLAVVHGPTQAQALVSSLFPNVFPLATSEPAMLFLTAARAPESRLGRPRPNALAPLPRPAPISFSRREAYD